MEHDGLVSLASSVQLAVSRRPSAEEAEEAVRTLIRYLGDDPNRPGLLETPARYARMLDELRTDANAVIAMTVFDEAHEDMIIVRGIPLYSLCEHHLSAWMGTADIGYIPNNQILGLSKLARVVRKISAGLTTQERVTRLIADEISKGADSLHVAVTTRATHSCMSARGVRVHGTDTVISCTLGSFREDSSARSEFLALSASGR